MSLEKRIEEIMEQASKSDDLEVIMAGYCDMVIIALQLEHQKIELLNNRIALLEERVFPNKETNSV